MDQELFIQQITPSLTILLVAMFASVIGALVLGVLALSGKRVHGGLAGIVAGPIALTTLGLCTWFTVGGGANPQAAVYGALGVGLFGVFFALVPVFLGGVLTAAAGAIKGPREPVWLALALVPGLMAVVAPLVAGLWVGQGIELLAIVRTGLYVPALILTFAALLSGDRSEGAGPEAAAMATAGFAGLVVLGETSGRALFYFLLLGEFAGMDNPAQRLELVESVRANLLGPTTIGSWIAVSGAVLVAAIGLASVLRRRRWSDALGVLWLPVWVLPLVLIDVPDSLWWAFAESLG